MPPLLFCMANGKATDTGPDPQKRDPGYYQPNGQSCGGPPCDQCSGKQYHAWSQGQAPWGSQPYDLYSPNTIKDKGCALTDYALLLNFLGIMINIGYGPVAVTPDTLNIWLEQNGGYSPDEPLRGMIDPEVIKKLYPALKVIYTSNLFSLDAALTNCRPAMVMVAATSGIGPHWVTVTKKTCNGYEIIDPAHKDFTNLSAYGNNFTQVVSF